MKCSSCGLPLSPTRTTCPRCGTPYAVGKSSSSAKTAPENGAQNQVSFVGQEPGFAPRATQESGPGWDPQSQGSVLTQPQDGNGQQEPYSFLPQGQQQPYMPHWQPAPDEGPFGHHIPQRPQQKPLSRPVIVGLSVAALCVVLGGMILGIVYFMAQGVNTPTANVDPTPTTTVPGQTAVPATPTPAITPTATYPGQKYIDNAQMASSVKPLQTSTSFSASQPIYVTFSIHATTSGAACLRWYLNGTLFFPYQLPITPGMQSASSYLNVSGSGSGYVEIYWASSVSCSDAQLAQKTTFTVTG